ncbi:MAG TPA: hypothetical protein VNN77_07615 [candidate division Zixibacteria bacterium]|nr:hypothetical protein [candidate division Zixibacteria bacterium]
MKKALLALTLVLGLNTAASIIGLSGGFVHAQESPEPAPKPDAPEKPD